MLPKTRKHRNRCKGKSLIAAGKLNPAQWQKIPKGEIARALKEQEGLPVKEVRKVHHLQHQVCISYVNTEGNICSSFFSSNREEPGTVLKGSDRRNRGQSIW